jgi:AcrR family transcriptional regulator
MSTQKRRYELKARAESQQATRRRITAAAVELHGEVGVAKTTVSDIARRAGVQRLTVYNHFPDLGALLPACTAHWSADHPMPDLDDALALEDPAERLRAALERLYAWWAETASMWSRVLGERASVPELDAWLAQSIDRDLAGLAERLAVGFEGADARARVALAVDFWTWWRLDREGLDAAGAAALVSGMVAATPRG